MKGSILIIGAGSAGSVVIKKCAMNRDIFKEIHIASRTLEKCKKIASECESPINSISQLDANDSNAVYELIMKVKPDLVINMALPYQDLSIMQACLKAKVHYLDTANYEHPDEAKFSYGPQWEYQDKFKKAGIMALLGSGFDPGVTNVFSAYARDNLFDFIKYIDIVDCNAGDHGKAFATNFNPEINIREVTQKGKFWENGKWIETDPLSIKKEIDFPEVGHKDAYLMYHEEMESLVKNIPGLKRIRFWMTFSKKYLTYLDVLQNIGMTRIDEVEFEGHKIVPLKFLKVLLPEPSSLAENYTGKTSIGCIIQGMKDGQEKKIFIYNVCDHAVCYKEVKAQAVGYTTGVPAMIGAMMILKGIWSGQGVFNMEEFDAKPFLDEMNKQGLPWQIKDLVK